MESYKVRVEKIMEVIRKRDDYIESHSFANFGTDTIKYYNQSSGIGYFSLTFDGVTLVHHNTDSFELDFGNWDLWDTFVLDKWLTKLEKIVQQSTLVLNGKKYMLTELGEI